MSIWRSLLMITQVKHVSIAIKDQKKALKFYTEVLGFKVVTDVELAPGEQRWIKLEIPGADTQIVLFTMEGHEDRIGTFSNIVFHTNDVKKTSAALKKKGVVFTQEPIEEPWGTYALFNDIDGNTFCLSST